MTVKKWVGPIRYEVSDPATPVLVLALAYTDLSWMGLDQLYAKTLVGIDAIEEYASKRAALRGVVENILESHGVTPDMIEHWFSNSPLVGTGAKQIDPRPTIAGLRDALSVRALWDIAIYGAMGIRRTRDAITYPSSHGVTHTRSKTGYAFGENCHCISLEKGLEVAKAEAEGTLTAPKGAVPTITPTTHAKKEEPTMEKTELKIVGVGSLLAVYALIARHYNIKTLEDWKEAATTTIQQLFEQGALIIEKDGLLTEFDTYIKGSLTKHTIEGWFSNPSKPATGSGTIARCVKHLLEANSITPGDVQATELSSALVAILEDDGADAPAPKPEAPAPATFEIPKLPVPSSEKAMLINLTLKDAGLPNLGAIFGMLEQAGDLVKTAKAQVEEAKAEATKASAAPALSLAPVVFEPTGGATTGEWPKGKLVMQPAWKVFGLDKAKDTFRFDVPTWEWDNQHPEVPAVDDGYVFRPFELFRLLTSIVANKRMYLHGDTGSGKTTMLEQTAARLSYPFMRLNMDSDITRDMLIGKHDLVQEDGVTVTKWIDGLVPRMIGGPVMGCLDEFDFGRSDIMYSIQSVMEGNGLRILEDGGRLVKPHPMSRLFATGNTVGQGDEKGMYQGARQQSLALLDRFERWMHVDYLDAGDRFKLIEKAAPNLDADLKKRVGKYVTEHITAFREATVLQPITPRGYMDLAQTLHVYVSYWPKDQREKAISEAVATSVLDRATMQDRVVLKGIADRVFG